MLIEHLDRREVEPCVVLHEEGKLSDYLGARSLEFELLPIREFCKPPYWSLRNIATVIMQTWRISRFLKRQCVDVVHSNDVRIHYGWTLATRLAGIPLVWHQRTGTFGRSFAKEKLALLSQQIVCISQYIVTTLPRRLVRLSRVVANPFDVSFAALDRVAQRRLLLDELALPSETRIIGFFGNLVDQKRPEVFLRSVALLDGALSAPFVYLLFGADRDGARARLTCLAEELGIGQRVHFMGFRAPVEPWLAGCDLMIAPGIGEGLGRSLVEAMIVGTPLVAADSGGHREVVLPGDNGLLAAADDPADFAAKASQILGDRSLAERMMQQAQAAAIREHSIERHVKAMTEIYREAVWRRPSHNLAVVSRSGARQP
jgi:glycosyltransferase involved in cell wall biosynthesis